MKLRCVILYGPMKGRLYFHEDCVKGLQGAFPGCIDRCDSPQDSGEGEGEVTEASDSRGIDECDKVNTLAEAVLSPSGLAVTTKQARHIRCHLKYQGYTRSQLFCNGMHYNMYLAELVYIQFAK